jgi:hypothetical protein
MRAGVDAAFQNQKPGRLAGLFPVRDARGLFPGVRQRCFVKSNGID